MRSRKPSAANLGFNPSNNGDNIIIQVPMLTEERRKDLVKMSNKEGENAKVSIRGAPRPWKASRRPVRTDFRKMPPIG